MKKKYPKRYAILEALIERNSQGVTTLDGMTGTLGVMTPDLPTYIGNLKGEGVVIADERRTKGEPYKTYTLGGTAENKKYAKELVNQKRLASGLTIKYMEI